MSDDDGKVVVKPGMVIDNPANPTWSKSMESQQSSRWVAYMADKTTKTEDKTEWDEIVAQKSKLVALGLAVPRLSVIVPRLRGFSGFELTNGKGIGSIVDNAGNVMYVEAVPTKGIAILKVGHISELQAKLYDMNEIKTDGGNALAMDMPGSMLMIPAGNKNFQFIQYKDGLHEIVGGREHFLGQVIGAVVDRFGNYIYAYYDSKEQTIIIMMNNMFAKSCKLGWSNQGIKKSDYTDPFQPKFGKEAKVISFPEKERLIH